MSPRRITMEGNEDILITQPEQLSRVERTRYGARESSKVILEADNMSVRSSPSGELVIELFRYDEKTDRPLESYSFYFSPLDRSRLRKTA